PPRRCVLLASSSSLPFFPTIPLPPPSILFPYTTLFRSIAAQQKGDLMNGTLTRHVLAVLSFLAVIAVPRASAQAARVFLSGNDKDRKSTRLNSSHQIISYAVFCLKKKNTTARTTRTCK